MARKGHAEACAFPASEEQGLIYVHYYIALHYIASNEQRTANSGRWPGGKNEQEQPRERAAAAAAAAAPSTEFN